MPPNMKSKVKPKMTPARGKTKRAAGKLKARPFLKEPGRFICSAYESTVIEFSRSFHGREKTVRAGRIWADGPRFFSEPEFGKWYEKLERWIRKHYSRVDDRMSYAGPEALVLYKAAGRPVNRIPAGENPIGWM